MRPNDALTLPLKQPNWAIPSEPKNSYAKLTPCFQRKRPKVREPLSDSCILTRHEQLFSADLLARMRSAKQSPKSGANGGPRKRTNATNASADTSSTSTDATPKDYTTEQLELCRRIKRCKDYYEVLSVTKEATDTEIKKSYKKLALQLHPDKNRAPGAVEAFKTLGNAAGVLTDAEKRKNYDLYGEEGRRSFSRHQYHDNHEYEHAYRGAGSGFESDFTAEELFNMFFGNGFPQPRATGNARRYHSRHETPVSSVLLITRTSGASTDIYCLCPFQHHYHHHQQQQPSLAFGIILVLILISMLSSFFTSDSIYSLAQTP